jgi:hypothetical protein
MSTKASDILRNPEECSNLNKDAVVSRDVENILGVE